MQVKNRLYTEAPDNSIQHSTLYAQMLLVCVHEITKQCSPSFVKFGTDLKR